jgi:ABC-type uncharacterized transport system permease subunit
MLKTCISGSALPRLEMGKFHFVGSLRILCFYPIAIPAVEQGSVVPESALGKSTHFALIWLTPIAAIIHYLGRRYIVKRTERVQ